MFLHPQDEAASEMFVWQANGIGVTAELSVGVLHAIRGQLARAEEFGGILLGSAESGEESHRTRVEAFEPFPIEHRYGLGFSLSLRDQKRLRQRVEKLERGRRRPVGIFRTHLRRGLYLDQRDYEVFSNEFRGPSSLFLVVRADEAEGARGGLFVWDGQDLRRHASYQEFAIGGAGVHAAAAAVAPAVTVRERPAVAAAAQPVAARVAAAPVEPRRFRPSAPAAPAGPIAAPAAAARVRPAALWPAVTAWTRSAVEGVDMRRLRAASVVAAGMFVLLTTFYVGRAVGLREQHEQRKEQPQPRAERRRPAPRRPALQPPPAAETVRAVDLASQPFEVPRPDEGGGETVAAPNYRERATPAALRASARKQRRTWHGAPAVTAMAGAPPPALPDPPALSRTPMPQIPKLAIPANLPHGPAQRVVAYIKPSQSLLRRLPVLRAFSRDNEKFVPANPLEHPLPAGGGKADRDGDASVELAAKIDRSGKVVAVKMMQGSNELARASALVLYRWRFEPARQDGEPVESEMLVRFEFGESPQ